MFSNEEGRRAALPARVRVCFNTGVASYRGGGGGGGRPARSEVRRRASVPPLRARYVRMEPTNSANVHTTTNRTNNRVVVLSMSRLVSAFNAMLRRSITTNHVVLSICPRNKFHMHNYIQDIYEG